MCLKVFTAIRNAAYSGPSLSSRKKPGHHNEELRVYYPAFCSAGALPVLRGIAALFRCLAERQVNLARLGIEAILFGERQNQRDDLIAFLWKDHMCFPTLPRRRPEGLSSRCFFRKRFRVEVDQTGVGGYSSPSKRPSDPTSTANIASGRLPHRKSVSDTSTHRGRAESPFLQSSRCSVVPVRVSRTPSLPVARHVFRNSLSLFQPIHVRPRDLRTRSVAPIALVP